MAIKIARMPKARTTQEANFHHLVMDIGWFGLAFATTSRFLSVYAIHLGADATHLAWLTALPALVVLITSLFTGWWRKRFSDSVHAVFLPTLSWRLMFILLAMAPLFPKDLQPMWLIVSVAIPSIPNGVAGVVFLVMMRESVDSSRMPALMSRRMLALNVTIAIGVISAGAWLEFAPFPLNYQTMYLAGFVFALFSIWHVAQVRPQQNYQFERGSFLHRDLWRSPVMLNMVGLILVTHIAFFSVFPLLPLHLVQGMRAEDGFVALFGLFELAGGVIISTRTERLMQQFGHRLLIAMAMLGTATATAIIAMAPTLAMTLPAAMLLGASWTAVNIGLLGVMMSNAPTEQSTQYATIFMQSISFATFVGPFIGSQLLNGGLSLVTVLMIGAGLRIGAAALATVAFKTDTPISEERYG